MKNQAAPWVALVITLLLTAAAATSYRFAINARDQVRFDNAANVLLDRIHVRMDQYVGALRGGVGLFAASDHVSEEEFRQYVTHVDVQSHYPGIQGIGFAQRVVPEALDSVVRMVRAAGSPEFMVRPAGERELYFPIVYLEPQDLRNQEAVGYDMYSDPTRAEAMDRARDSGAAALSGKVRLVQELDSPDPQPGFLVYQPVYSSRSVPDTREGRHAAHQGYVYSPFRAWDLFRAMFADSVRLQLAFRVYDSHETSDSTLLYDSQPGGSTRDPGGWRRTETIEIAGHPWTFQLETTTAFATGQGRWLLPLIIVVGVLVSLVLFVMTHWQVQARARAEETEMARGRFFAAMSHELRTPINAIMGYNDLLLGGVYGSLPAGQVVGLERAQKAVRHLAELVNDVLDLSKIEAGKVRLDIETVQVSQVIDDLLSTIRPLAESRGSTLDLQHASCDRTIETDPRRLRQILLNLLSNAAKFGGGKPITVRCVATGEGVAIEVTDRGSGITKEDMSRIFEEFVQLERGDDGTGLGLAISRRLAMLLCGSLDVESEVGVGSTFRLTLPGRMARPRSS